MAFPPARRGQHFRRPGGAHIFAGPAMALLFEPQLLRAVGVVLLLLVLLWESSMPWEVTNASMQNCALRALEHLRKLPGSPSGRASAAVIGEPPLACRSSCHSLPGRALRPPT